MVLLLFNSGVRELNFKWHAFQSGPDEIEIEEHLNYNGEEPGLGET